IGGVIDDILRSDVADHPVDYGDLAVVAQIETHAAASEYAQREQRNDFDSCGAQTAGGVMQGRARSHAVEQQPAGYSALRGLLDGFRGAMTGLIVGKNVVEQMYALLRRSNVLKQPLQRGLIFGQQLDTIGRGNLEAPQVTCQASCLGDLG